MYPKTRFYLNTNLKGFRHPYPQETDESFSDIKNRVQRDKINIQKMCSEYLSSNPEPEKPPKNPKENFEKVLSKRPKDS